MKVTNLKLLGACGLAIGMLSVQTITAADATAADSVKTHLSSVSALDLPSKTAGMIAAAADQNKAEVTVSAVTAAVKLNPAGAPAIVAAIAKQTPAMASLAASTAVKLQPKQASAIAKSATTAAPDQAREIFAACDSAIAPAAAAVAAPAAAAAPAYRAGAPTAGDSIPHPEIPVIKLQDTPQLEQGVHRDYSRPL